MSNTKRILDIETLHSDPLIDIIKILNGAIHELTMVIKENEISIATSNESKSIYIKLIFKASEFNKFYTKYERLELGINLDHLNTHISSMANSSVLSLYINENDKQTLCIEGYNSKENSITKSELKLMELNYQEKKRKKLNVSVYVLMKSSIFYNICKEMKSISDYVDIKCTTNKLIFSCKGDSGKKERTCTEKEGGISIEWEEVPYKLVHGIYELKNIILFDKCVKLSKQVLILMNNDDDILSIKHVIANLGEMIIVFAPYDEDKITNNYNYSDDEDEILLNENLEDDDDES